MTAESLSLSTRDATLGSQSSFFINHVIFYFSNAQPIHTKLSSTTDSEEGKAPDLDALPRRWIRRRVRVADRAVETEVTREFYKRNKA